MKKETKKNENYVTKIAHVIRELGINFPKQKISTHIALALHEYNNFDGISNRELFYLLDKYRCEKELDMLAQTSDDEIFDIESYEEEDFDDGM